MKQLLFILALLLLPITSAIQVYDIPIAGQLIDVDGNLITGSTNNLIIILENSSNNIIFNRTYINITLDSQSRYFEFMNVSYDFHDNVTMRSAVNNDTLSSETFIGYVPYAIEAKFLDGKNGSFYINQISSVNDTIFLALDNATIIRTGNTSWIIDNQAYWNDTDAQFTNLNVTDGNLTVNNVAFIDRIGTAIRKVTKGWFKFIQADEINSTNSTALNFFKGTEEMNSTPELDTRYWNIDGDTGLSGTHSGDYNLSLGTGRIGIGISTPTSELHVIGSANITGLIYGNGSQLTSLNHSLDDAYDDGKIINIDNGNLIFDITSGNNFTIQFDELDMLKFEPDKYWIKGYNDVFINFINTVLWIPRAAGFQSPITDESEAGLIQLRTDTEKFYGNVNGTLASGSDDGGWLPFNQNLSEVMDMGGCDNCLTGSEVNHSLQNAYDDGKTITVNDGNLTFNLDSTKPSKFMIQGDGFEMITVDPYDWRMNLGWGVILNASHAWIRVSHVTTFVNDPSNTVGILYLRTDENKFYVSTKQGEYSTFGVIEENVTFDTGNFSKVIISTLSNCDTINTTSDGELVCGDDAAAAGLDSAYNEGENVIDVDTDDIVWNLTSTQDFRIMEDNNREVFKVDNTGDTYIGNARYDQILSHGLGQSNEPDYSFVNDPDTGMYRIGTNDLAFAGGGSTILYLIDNQILAGVITAESSPQFSHSNDENTGMSVGANDNLKLIAGGIEFYIANEGTQDISIFNDDGLDMDFRIESDTNPNAFFIDGETGKIGIGIATPTSALHVNGSIIARWGNFSWNGSNNLANDINESVKLWVYNGTLTSKVDVDGWISSNITGLNESVKLWVYNGTLAPNSSLGNYIKKTGDTGITGTYSGDYNLSLGTGRIGIGTASPSVALDVRGNISTNESLKIDGVSQDIIFRNEILNAFIETIGSGQLHIRNLASNMDINFSVNDGGTIKSIYIDASAFQLRSSTGIFDFGNDNLTTIRKMTMSEIRIDDSSSDAFIDSGFGSVSFDPNDVPILRGRNAVNNGNGLGIRDNLVVVNSDTGVSSLYLDDGAGRKAKFSFDNSTGIADFSGSPGIWRFDATVNVQNLQIENPLQLSTTLLIVISPPATNANADAFYTFTGQDGGAPSSLGDGRNGTSSLATYGGGSDGDACSSPGETCGSGGFGGIGNWVFDDGGDGGNYVSFGTSGIGGDGGGPLFRLGAKGLGGTGAADGFDGKAIIEESDGTNIFRADSSGIALGTQNSPGCSGCMNVTTLFYDTLTANSPQIFELGNGNILTWNGSIWVECDAKKRDDCPVKSEAKMTRVYAYRQEESDWNTLKYTCRNKTHSFPNLNSYRAGNIDCYYDEAKEIRDCLNLPYNYWDGNKCLENEYLKCSYSLTESWNYISRACDYDAKKDCQSQGKDYDDRTQTCEIGKRICLYDRSKYWTGTECISIVSVR